MIDPAALDLFPKTVYNDDMSSLKKLGLMCLLCICVLPPLATRAQMPNEDLRWSDLGTQQYVLTLARRAFEAYARRREVIDTPTDFPAVLGQQSGVFVSAQRNGAPRCCMGTLYPVHLNCAQEIVDSAVAAAGRDRRFAPIQPNELAHLTLIVSIVSRPRPITEAEADALDPVRDGLAAKCGEQWGVVLSGETAKRENMMAWARVRAGAKPGEQVEWFALSDVRMRETLRP
jgi:AMMECR1 domain-containing protein